MINQKGIRFLCDHISPKKYETYSHNLPKGYKITHDNDFTITSVKNNKNNLTIKLMDKFTNTEYSYTISI